MKHILFILILFTTVGGWANPNEVNSIKNVVQRWNDLHNSKHTDQFLQLYGPSVLFYGKYRDAEKCVEKKRTFLKAAYRQEIITPITVSFYSSGTIKCSFIKRVTNRKRAKEYPSYLLLQQNGDQYVVTGESDLITDENLGVQLDIGEEITGDSTSNAGFLTVIIGLIVTVTLGLYFRRKKRINNEIFENAFVVATEQEVEAGTTTERCAKEESLNRHYTKACNANTYVGEATAEPAPSAKQNAAKGNEFERYIVERFSNEYYQILEWRSDKFHAGRYAQSNMLPDLELRLLTKRYDITFAIECKWRKDFYQAEIEWAKDYQLRNYRKYQYDSGNLVFVVIGVGGQPSNPDATYIIPLDQIDSTRLTEKMLKKYYRYKKGNFFLHPEAMILE